MIQLRNDADLEVWPELIGWMDDQLLAVGSKFPYCPRSRDARSAPHERAEGLARG